MKPSEGSPKALGQLRRFAAFSNSHISCKGSQLSRHPYSINCRLVCRPESVLSNSVNAESTLWKGRPSQWLNLGHFVVGLLLISGIIAGGFFFPPVWIGLVIPFVYLLWRILVLRCQQYELTSERLRLTEGVVNQRIDEIELYRVKDVSLLRPLWMRMTGLSTVVLETSDRTTTTVVLPAIHRGTELRESLRQQVELIRDRKRVRELDLEESHLTQGDFAG